jgi:hypothetical protein
MSLFGKKAKVALPPLGSSGLGSPWQQLMSSQIQAQTLSGIGHLANIYYKKLAHPNLMISRNPYGLISVDCSVCGVGELVQPTASLAVSDIDPAVEQAVLKHVKCGVATQTINTETLEKLKKAEPRKILPKVPDHYEPITAWRAWKLSNLRLHALGSNGEWPVKKPIEAICNKKYASIADPAGVNITNHPAPNHNCECGVWAFNSLDNLMSAIQGHYHAAVLGQVSLWGRVIECENGFRAQYAYPKELWLFDNSLEELGYIYGVPVRTA